jgi:hypothetical protein
VDVRANMNGGNALYQPFLRKSFQTSINDGLVQVGFSFEMLSPYTCRQGLNIANLSRTKFLTFVCRDLDVTQHKIFLSGQAFSSGKK